MPHYKVKMLPVLAILLVISFCLSYVDQALAQDTETGQSNSASTGEKKNSSNAEKKQDLDSDSLFGGIDFVKGMGQAKTNSAANSTNQDEIEGEVIVTTNSYNYIQKPTGLIFGLVYEPPKDGKPPKQSSSSQNMITGLSLLMGAMQANSKGK